MWEAGGSGHVNYETCWGRSVFTYSRRLFMSLVEEELKSLDEKIAKALVFSSGGLYRTMTDDEFPFLYVCAVPKNDINPLQLCVVHLFTLYSSGGLHDEEVKRMNVTEGTSNDQNE